MLVAALLALYAGFVGVSAVAAAPEAAGVTVPAWLYPADSGAPSPPTASPGAPARPLHLPGSRASFTRAQLADLYGAPDWYPAAHAPMPAIVAHGRPPDVCACGYCHTPSGQGRPENAALAGLPAEYIVQQMRDFRGGSRRGAWRGAYAPADLMVRAARAASDAEVAQAARYFARQTLLPRVRIVETARVPRAQVVGLVYARVPGAGSEPLGARLMEFAPDAARHELRDERLGYVAYVPPGSVGRGERIARAGAGAAGTACVSCHGERLRGLGAAPPLAGRSPTYLLRALYAFRDGARGGAAAEPMLPVARSLDAGGMIDAVAYAASLPP